jgi:hypothetical protein
MTVTNTLAYCFTALITAVKRSMTQAGAYYQSPVNSGRLQPCLKILDQAKNTDSDKHSILLWYNINYNCKMFYD